MNKVYAPLFNLKATLESGQFFLYYLINDFYYIINGKNIFKVKQENLFLIYDNIDAKDIIEFFSLNQDYQQIYESFKNDVYLTKALKEYTGLRIINANLWQTIISFICSSCSNIPKITKNLELICQFFGNKITYDNIVFYTFPDPCQINNISLLELAKTGYRKDYIIKISDFYCKNPEQLSRLYSLDLKDLKEELKKFNGIGEKVASCIALFALKHKEAFPVDTWIKQIFETYYLENKTNNKDIEEYAKKIFKDNIGIKQQYLFHYFRNNKL